MLREDFPGVRRLCLRRRRSQYPVDIFSLPRDPFRLSARADKRSARRGYEMKETVGTRELKN
jgi:hypothetical protein